MPPMQCCASVTPCKLHQQQYLQVGRYRCCWLQMNPDTTGGPSCMVRTWRSSCLNSLKLWFVRKPMDPRWKDTTGGMWCLNKLLACRMTPSPPRHTTKSTCSAKLQDTAAHTQEAHFVRVLLSAQVLVSGVSAWLLILLLGNTSQTATAWPTALGRCTTAEVHATPGDCLGSCLLQNNSNANRQNPFT